MIKLFMISLGCAKNLVDSETMLGETLDNEFQLELDPTAADVIVVNTCGFIAEARDEARTVIAECLALKKKSKHPMRVVAAGCWAERWPEEVLKEFPALDAVWGLRTPSSLREAILALSDVPAISGVGKREAPREGARLLSTLPSYAYLRISDGCDNRCNYCAIPVIRGGLRSRRPEAIVDEARELEAMGAKELIVISQDTTAYGKDLNDADANLAALLDRLLAATGVPRIRLLYAHPAHLGDETIQLLLDEPRLCRYLDLPIQHVSDDVLRRMGRGYGEDRIRALLERFSGKGFTLRTTLLLGFPGESEADFGKALDLVKEGHFQQLGAFAYSPERDTPAESMDGQIPQPEAERRRDAIMEAQSEIAVAWLDSRLGGMEDVLIDSMEEDGILVGRTTSEAPDADGCVYLMDGESAPGDIIRACIKSRSGYDLYAERKASRRRPRRGRRR